MSLNNQNIELLQTTLKQLEIILKEIEGNVTENPEVLKDVKTLVNSTEKLVINLQNPVIKPREKPEENDFFTDEIDEVLITETPRKKTRKKSKNLPLIVGLIITLILVVAIAVWYFVLPEKGIKIPEFQPKIEQKTEEAPEEISEEIPSELTTPELPQPVETLTPELDLTPEQGLIAAIKNQITTIKNRYVEGLIIGIEPNFSASILTVKISNNWYDLETSNQNSIADDIFTEAKKLDFKKLQIINIQGEIVARSPIIGNNMIILNN